MTKTAKFIRTLTEGFRGTAKLYAVSPRIKYRTWNDSLDEVAKTAGFVVVSAADVPYTGPETYIFPADEKGEIVDWGELDGSQRGKVSHEHVLIEAGYELI